MIKAVLIDIDNTLLDFDKCAKSAIENACAVHGIKFQQKIYEAFAVINEGFWKQIERGELTKSELHRIRWATIFKHCGIDYDGPSFELTFRKTVAESSDKVDGAEELLKYLSTKYTVCVASNAAHSQQKNRLDKADLSKYIDKFFVSWDIGFDKPSKQFFSACLKELDGLKKDEVMMIGDSLTADIKGGIDFGIKTCWFNKFNAVLPKDINPNFVVKSLTEIIDLL